MGWMMLESETISSVCRARCSDGAGHSGGPFPRYARSRVHSPRIVLVLFALACLQGPLHAQAAPFGGSVALTSQLVDRGLPITSTTPVLQAELRWDSPAGWSLGSAGASELHSPRLAEGMLHAAYSWPLSDTWQMQASLLYYAVPRRGRARPYRRAEADLAWIYRDVFTLNLAALRPLGSRDGHTNPAAEANLRWPLTGHLSLLAGVGVARFQRGSYGYYGERYSEYYRYGQAALAWSAGRWHVELDRIATRGAPPARRGSDGLSPWLVSVSWSF
ncbi:hypothetical protein [Frateuria terrea]|uniref:Outer membrane protein n=1 Tax=Frateuria terrea TaxID=529704 RepID=A0A1H6WPD7_9GAMM|nr:hypothetical protein [Frateuria terrea]SEJ17646.1 conserved hypothetical protein [Frateuria terrea]SFP56522.1 conserved hypothetical protein [Frateuria terrea]